MTSSDSAKPAIGDSTGSRGSRSLGDVRDVVLLHGWGSSGGVWKELAAFLAPRYQLHIPDLPGYGATPGCVPYTLEGMTAAVSRAAPARCHVVGWSLGAQLALAWARRAPRQIDRIALISATPSFVQRADWPHAITADLLLGFSAELGMDRERTFKRFAALQAQGDDNARDVARKLRAAFTARGDADEAALAGGLQILLETDLRAGLDSIRHFVLVLQGDHDSLVPPAVGVHLNRRLPSARSAVVRGTAHAPFLSKPQEVAATLDEFFGE
jgi:pimeloyl-[acyl-carrier protein] methyl ester esterase